MLATIAGVRCYYFRYFPRGVWHLMWGTVHTRLFPKNLGLVRTDPLPLKAGKHVSLWWQVYPLLQSCCSVLGGVSGLLTPRSQECPSEGCGLALGSHSYLFSPQVGLAQLWLCWTLTRMACLTWPWGPPQWALSSSHTR